MTTLAHAEQIPDKRSKIVMVEIMTPNPRMPAKRQNNGKGEQPLVSVCMPLFNTERFVAQAIRGILDQTYQNIELIVCDNQSTDSSYAIAKEFAEKDSRVKLIRNRRNLGYAGNLHKVTSLAQGKFMMVHCADDHSEPQGIEKLILLATSEGVNQDRVIVISDAYVTDGKGQATGVIICNPSGYDNMHVPVSDYEAQGTVKRFGGKEALSYALPRLRIVGFLGATLYSRKLFESVEGVYNGLLYCPDLQYNYHLLSRDPEVLWLNEPLFNWRLHESNQISQAKAQAIPKHAFDTYTYTFHFSPSFLTDLGVKREDIVHEFIDTYCIHKALQEIKSGSMILALRHLFFSLATYPRETLRKPRFYVSLLGIMTGPIGRLMARAGYRVGIWRAKPVNLRGEKTEAGDSQTEPAFSHGA